MRNSGRDHDPLQLALKQARWRPDQAKLVVDAWKASGIRLGLPRKSGHIAKGEACDPYDIKKKKI